MKRLSSIVLATLLVYGLFAAEATDGTSTDDATSDDATESFDVKEVVESLAKKRSASEWSRVKSFDDGGRAQEESKTNLDSRLVHGLTTIEELVPELSGISNTWETTDTSTRFADLTIALAKFHEPNGEKVDRLSEAINNLKSVVPENEQSLLKSDMSFFSKQLVENFDLVQSRLSGVTSDANVVLDLKANLLRLYPDISVGFADRFESCIDTLTDKNRKGFTKLFSAVTRRLERATKSIEKIKTSDKDFSRKARRTVMNIFPNFIIEFANIRRSVQPTICYRKIDYEQILRTVRESS